MCWKQCFWVLGDLKSKDPFQSGKEKIGSAVLQGAITSVSMTRHWTSSVGEFTSAINAANAAVETMLIFFLQKWNSTLSIFFPLIKMDYLKEWASKQDDRVWLWHSGIKLNWRFLICASQKAQKNTLGCAKRDLLDNRERFQRRKKSLCRKV